MYVRWVITASEVEDVPVHAVDATRRATCEAVRTCCIPVSAVQNGVSVGF